MQSLLIGPLAIVPDEVEIVERKGLGHPDTICDALAETLSRNLCREYRKLFGHILHHNVDKALLCGGRTAAAFGAGKILEPINIYLAGRASTGVPGAEIPVREIAIDSARAWLSTNLHAFDVDKGVKCHALIKPGSSDLQNLFTRRSKTRIPVANDTSIGVGHAPLSILERLVLLLERHINTEDRALSHPAWGEDVKIMAIRQGNAVHLTIANAIIGRYVAHIDDYLGEKASIAATARKLAEQIGFQGCSVDVNAGDDPSAAAVYLTVTGTSAEAGDDGQVGRGNRANGLITPCRPMSLEATAGKNPVNHVGKIYNVVATDIANSITAATEEIIAADCILVSQIGTPITDPALAQVRIMARGGAPTNHFRPLIEEIVADRLARVPELVEDFVAGRIQTY